MLEQEYNLTPLIEAHYKINFNRLVKKMAFQTGSFAAGEDVVQTAYERAIRYQDSCDPDRFSNWFSTLLANSFKDYIRSERGSFSTEEEEEEEAQLGCPHYSAQIMREIEELIDTKSIEQIQILRLYFKHEYSAKDVAAITEFTYSKCHHVISRFRDELRDLYHE